MQTPEQIAEQLVADWQAAEKMPQMAWDFRGFAAEAARRAVANGADACEQVAMKHQQTDGTYAAGKKARPMNNKQEAEQRDPQLRELKEHVRAAVAWVNRAADDDEMSRALRAENQAIEALVLYIFQ